MSKEILDTLTILADSTRQQLEQQLALIEALRGLQGAAPRTRKVRNKSSKKSDPKIISEAEKLIRQVIKLCSDAPYSKQELLEKTGASDGRVKNTITRLKSKEFPEWKMENLGTERRARWFLRPTGKASKKR